MVGVKFLRSLFVLCVSLGVGGLAVPALAYDNRAKCNTATTEYIAWQEKVSDIDTYARDKYPGDYSWSRITGCSAEIRFKSAIPSDIFDMSKKVDNLTVSGNTGFSENEIIEEQIDAFLQTTRTIGEGATAYTDKATQTIHIGVPKEKAAKLDSLAVSLKASELSLPQQAQPKFRVVFDLVNTTQSGYDALYGGGYLTFCTTAFSVYGSGSSNGLLTAGHCTNQTQSYGSVPLTLMSSHQGRYGDVAWYSTSAWTAPQFYTLPSQLVPVTAVKYPVVGQKLCLNGQGTRGRFCNESVWNVRTCSSNGICGLTAMSGRQAREGDSGGPWFSSSYAYGVHSGHVPFDIERDVFTPVITAESVLGVTVKTQ